MTTRAVWTFSLFTWAFGNVAEVFQVSWITFTLVDQSFEASV
jgi:hypothetical protein